MGVAVRSGVIAVGARAQIWFLRSAPDLAPRFEPLGGHDACFVTRSSRFAGEIQGHEMAWSGEELWLVNTAFSCLCTLHPEHSFEPRWRPQFVSTLAPEDRCHLNGLAIMDGRPSYELTFFLASDGRTPNEFQVSFGGTTFDESNLSAFDYSSMSITLTATSSSTLLQFGFRDDDGFFNLDDVGVSAVPEPTSLALMSLGVAAMLVSVRSRVRRPRTNDAKSRKKT